MPGLTDGGLYEIALALEPPTVVAAAVFLIAIHVVAKTLAAFAAIIQSNLAVRYDLRLELAMVTGQVLFQWAFLWRWPREDKLSYAWILIAVSTLGAVLLWPQLEIGRAHV